MRMTMPVQMAAVVNISIALLLLMSTASLTAKPSPPPQIPPYPRTKPCDRGPLKGSAACDSSVPLEQRVQTVVRMLPKDEAFAMFSDASTGSSTLNIPYYNWWSEALHGVSRCPYQHFLPENETVSGSCCAKGRAGLRKCPTSFPAGITTSAAFNRTLFHAIGTAIGTEARVMSNAGIASLTFWTPNVNIFRDPRWGRGQETPGEDPTLNSDYAADFVKGFQSGEDPLHLKASSCCKHYAGYSLESWSPKGSLDPKPTTRHDFDAVISAQDLADTYLPAFRSCANRGNASGVMCSYNAVNGVPSCASKELLDGTLRDKWGFDGYVTSDCGAVGNVERAHNFTCVGCDDETCAATLGAGMDNDCGDFFGGKNGSLSRAIRDGSVTTAMREKALGNLIRVQMRLGMWDDDSEQPYRRYGTEMVDTSEHRALALEAARQGIVLLKNRNGVLPLSRNHVKTLAAVGPHCNATEALQSNYHGQAPYLVSPAEGLRKYATILTEAGCSIGQCAGCHAKVKHKPSPPPPSPAPLTSPSIARAVALAAGADAAILLVGMDGTVEGEGHDRYAINIPGNQSELIDEVSKVSKGPVVIVYIGGGCVDMAAWKASPHIDAILIAGYPGQEGGNAIAQTLFGDNNPAGRLTTTWYAESYLEQCSMLDMNMRPETKPAMPEWPICPGRSYRFFTGSPVFQFGSGMSYTTFEHTIATTTLNGWRYDSMTDHKELRMTLSKSRLSEQIEQTRNHPHKAPTVLSVDVDVVNTGLLDGDEVLLAYAVPPNAGLYGAPLRSLVQYERIHVEHGRVRRVTLHFTAHNFALANAAGAIEISVGIWTLEIGRTAVSAAVAN